MALNTQFPIINSIGGNPWPEVNGAVKLSFVFGVGGSQGGWTAEEAQLGAEAVGAWLDVADIGFGDPGDVPPGYVLQILKESFPDERNLGKAAYPNSPPQVVLFNATSPAWEKGLQPGGLMYQTLIHELGHALGLAHPHDTDMATPLFPGVDGFDEDGNPINIVSDRGSHGLNSAPYTVMGYNRADDVSEPDYDLKLSFGEGYMVTPGAFDIAAVQLMYGAVAHNEGNDVYILRGNFDGSPNASFTTIWDTAGIDTIQYDGGDPAYDNDAASRVYIDLRYATLKDEPGGGGYVSHFTGNTSFNGGFTIAADVTDFDHDGKFGVIIENAVGGPGRDIITGNEVANELNGRGGSDKLRGMGDSDKLTGGADRDVFLFDPNWGQDTITDFFVGNEFSGEDLIFILGSGVTSFGQLEKSLTAEGYLKLEYQGNSIILNNVGLNDLQNYHLQFDRKVEDGRISGATVFADANNNGELDLGEASTTTDANGTFVLGGSGPLIAFGGTDIDTGLPFAGKLKAPAGSVVITPLTTLLVAGVSESDILTALNLPSGFDLRLGDPIAGLLAGHAGSAAVFVAGVKVIDTVIAIATAVAGLGGDEADAMADAFAALAAAINNLGAGQTLDLSDPATIASLLNTVAQDQGVDASALASAVANAVAQSNAAIDDHLATDGASQALLTNVSATQGELQSNDAPDAVDDSVAVLKGKTLLGNVLTNDSDPDGDTIQVVSIEGGSVGTTFAGKFGTLTIEADGDYTYVANKKGLPSKFVAQDSFDYGITDGSTGAASATLSVLVLSGGQKYQAGENTTLTGTNGKDVLDGSAGGVTALGGKGADILLGGPGNILTGGKGPDFFVFRPEFGANTITDFEWKGVKPNGDEYPGGDKIQIDASVFATFADVLAHASDTQAGVLIDDGEGNTITLTGVKLTQLHAGDFLLV